MERQVLDGAAADAFAAVSGGAVNDDPPAVGPGQAEQAAEGFGGEGAVQKQPAVVVGPAAVDDFGSGGFDVIPGAGRPLAPAVAAGPEIQFGPSGGLVNGNRLAAQAGVVEEVQELHAGPAGADGSDEQGVLALMGQFLGHDGPYPAQLSKVAVPDADAFGQGVADDDYFGVVGHAATSLAGTVAASGVGAGVGPGHGGGKAGPAGTVLFRGAGRRALGRGRAAGVCRELAGRLPGRTAAAVAGGAVGSGILGKLPYRYAGLGGDADHMGGARAAGKGGYQVGRAVPQHPGVPVQAGAVVVAPVHPPLGGKLPDRDVPLLGPAAGQGVSAAGGAMKQAADRRGGVELIQAGGEKGIVGVVAAAADQEGDGLAFGVRHEGVPPVSGYAVRAAPASAASDPEGGERRQ